MPVVAVSLAVSLALGFVPAQLRPVQQPLRVHAVSPGRRVVVTLSLGKRTHFGVTRLTMEAYARRVGADFAVVDSLGHASLAAWNATALRVDGLDSLRALTLAPDGPQHLAQLPLGGDERREHIREAPAGEEGHVPRPRQGGAPAARGPGQASVSLAGPSLPRDSFWQRRRTHSTLAAVMIPRVPSAPMKSCLMS